MSYKKSILFLMALVIALAFTHPSFAVEIKGKVVEVEGSRAKIEYQSDFAPREGDAVQIGEELIGTFILVGGDWKVVKVTRDFVWAESKSADAGTSLPKLIEKK